MPESKLRFGSIFVLLVALLAIGTVAFHGLERWSLVDSFYFTATTLTTIGYGDLTPTTDLSKIATVAFALSGVAIFLYSLGLIAGHYLQKGQQFEEYEKEKIREIISNLHMPFRRKKSLKK